VNAVTIGELSARTGVPVRTLRFYVDVGVLPLAGRTESGYRIFGADAVARARLVRTLRELGVGLTDVKRVLAGQASLEDVAAAHAELGRCVGVGHEGCSRPRWQTTSQLSQAARLHVLAPGLVGVTYSNALRFLGAACR
jgi:DNA-binding transcriptional MerR regulator